jgi:hypothetical protein
VMRGVAFTAAQNTLCPTVLPFASKRVFKFKQPIVVRLVCEPLGPSGLSLCFVGFDAPNGFVGADLIDHSGDQRLNFIAIVAHRVASMLRGVADTHCN